MPAGATSLLRLRPRALLADDATMRVVLAVVPTERLDAFARRHGVDAREMDLMLHATYPPSGSIVLASGPFHAQVVVGEIGHRMAPLESSSDAPLYRRAGIYRMHRFELLALGSHEVAVIDGPPELAGLVIHARREPTPAAEPDPSATRLRSIVAEERDAPFLFVQHGRPDLPPEGVGLLVARLEDASIAVAPVGSSDPGALALRARLFGEFPPGAEDNFRILIASLSEADLGRAVGLEEIARSLDITVLEGEIRLGARVRATTLARGLRIVLGAEIDEMLDDVSGT